MKSDIHLFIGGKEVELSQSPEILFNYRVTDLSNPTVVSNSYTKTITLQGTPQNNDVFGHIWNLERRQFVGSGEWTQYNPLEKTSFSIYVDGALYEAGYCKMDSVVRNGKSTQYNLTLYGGLGEFFYNLSYPYGDETNNRLTLADLDYTENDGEVIPNLDFNISKEAVWDAWQTILGNPNAVYDEADADRPNNYVYDDKWRVINFAPCYNGIPEGFDSNKFLINTNGLPNSMRTTYTEDGTTYNPVGGFLTGIANNDEGLTEWESLDLRSYLQRPVLSIKRFIDAIRNPQNNGGYRVELDSHFFSAENPYYNKAWMTLPMLRDIIDGGGETQTITNASLTYDGNRFLAVNTPNTTVSQFGDLEMTLTPTFTASSLSNYTRLYPSTLYLANEHQEDMVFRFETNMSVIVQLLAFDTAGGITGQSTAYVLGGAGKDGKSGDFCGTPDLDNPYGFYNSGENPDVRPSKVEYIKGHWAKQSNGKYRFVSTATGLPISLSFSLNSNNNFDHLKLKVKTPYKEFYFLCGSGIDTYAIGDVDDNTGLSNFHLYTTQKRTQQTPADIATVRAANRVDGTISFTIDSFKLSATDYEAFFSGTKITKERLLLLEHTPAEYLISYAKLFGLYFYKDPTEEAEDTSKYPNGVIHIVDRDTFYDENDVVNLSKLVDRSKDMTITPCVAESKWYDFSVPQVDSDAANSYKDLYGYEYGRRLVNTGYNYNGETTELYDGNTFNGGIMVLEKDKYFSQPVDDLPVFVYNGFTYSLYTLNEDDEYESYEIDFPSKRVDNVCMNTDSLANYDSFPKPQFHTENNSAGSGDGVLLFFYGNISPTGINGNTSYWLTDDISAMATLNDSTPCWLMTNNEYTPSPNSQHIAFEITNFPYFTRDYISNVGNGSIIHTWDFGNPQVTFIPYTYNTYEMGIYAKCWRDYINDMYDVDTRMLSCYVKTEGMPSVEWLRRFYWFDNSIWRLNEISEWKVGGDDSTLMKFIKVQDLESYSLDAISYSGAFYIIIDQASVGYNGGTITGRVYNQSGEAWWFNPDGGTFTATDSAGNVYYYDLSDYVSPVQGSGNVTEFTVTVPANTTGLPLTYSIFATDNYDRAVYGSWSQSPDTTPVLRWNADSMQRTYDAAQHLGERLNFTYNNIREDSIALEFSGNTSIISSYTINTAAGYVEVNINPNSTSSTRTVSLIISGSNGLGTTVQAEATITQTEAFYLSASPSTIRLDHISNAADDVTITSNTDYDITINDE